MTGVLNLNKPQGMTSHDVVARVRRILGVKRVGHAGTLDPGASGVLVLLVGAATRLAEFATADDKEYRFQVMFGIETDTLDMEGQVLREESAGGVTAGAVREVVPQLVGDIKMVPPMYSAVRHGGRRLYKLARQGMTVAREPRTVRVASLWLEEFTADPRHPKAVLGVVCSKGTYVRCLAQMLGKRLGTVACVSELVRTRVGEFRIEDALSLDELARVVAEKGVAAALLPADRVVPDLAVVRLEYAEALRVCSGQEGLGSSEEAPDSGDLVRAYVEDGTLFAVGAVVGRRERKVFVAPRKVLCDLRHKIP